MCAVVACTQNGRVAAGDGGTDPSSLVGSPCIPAEELSPSFAGFNELEVTLETDSPSCGGGVCLVNHFRGRVTCPYGQDKDGHTLGGASACTVPGTGAAVHPSMSHGVPAQCTDRSAAKTVTCSCRCANAAGRTDDGATYCACPSGLTCAQVVGGIGDGDPLAGGYCVPLGADFDRATACQIECDPTAATCSAPNAAAKVEGAGTVHRYFTAPLRLEHGLCSGEELPVDASGHAQCRLFYVLAGAEACSAHVGLADATSDVAASVRTASDVDGSHAVCEVPQLTAPCASAAQSGWCYLTGANAPSGCTQSIDVSPSGAPPLGAQALLACP